MKGDRARQSWHRSSAAVGPDVQQALASRQATCGGHRLHAKVHGWRVAMDKSAVGGLERLTLK